MTFEVFGMTRLMIHCCCEMGLCYYTMCGQLKVVRGQWVRRYLASIQCLFLIERKDEYTRLK